MHITYYHPDEEGVICLFVEVKAEESLPKSAYLHVDILDTGLVTVALRANGLELARTSNQLVKPHTSNTQEGDPEPVPYIVEGVVSPLWVMHSNRVSQLRVTLRDYHHIPLGGYPDCRQKLAFLRLKVE